MEDVHDHITKVQQYPAPFRTPFLPDALRYILSKALLHLIGDGLHHTFTTAAADQESIGESDVL